MKAIMISNNPLVWNKYPQTVKVQGDFKDVLIKARNSIHQGQYLLTHPLTGSIKPNQQPYKSIILQNPKDTKAVNLESLQLIEDALAVANKFGPVQINLPEHVLNDFQVIDLSFMESAWDSIKTTGIKL